MPYGQNVQPPPRKNILQFCTATAPPPRWNLPTGATVAGGAGAGGALAGRAGAGG